MRVLRCLRDLEKWSWIGKMGKNEENGVKKKLPQNPQLYTTFPYASPCKTCDPRGWAKFDPRGMLLALLVEAY